MSGTRSAAGSIPDHSPTQTGDSWSRRIARDRRAAAWNQTPQQRRITEILLDRARNAGDEAFALTGSTARLRRTPISDLDYHVVGPQPQSDDLPDEVDVYATDAASLWRKLREGDDFVQWTLRFGWILLDSGIFHAMWREIEATELWPDPGLRLNRLPQHKRIARRLLEMGDRDAAQDQIRATLTSAARALLLEAGQFPLARAELPGQLRTLGAVTLASALDDLIHEDPDLDELAAALHSMEALTLPDGARGRKRSKQPKGP